MDSRPVAVGEFVEVGGGGAELPETAEAAFDDVAVPESSRSKTGGPQPARPRRRRLTFCSAGRGSRFEYFARERAAARRFGQMGRST
ncbi:hypothetical protein JOC24_005884 [Streptomyces sp. HB132]|nr:hypothetical protein [Streptomyces sp. HB132]